MMTMTSAGQAGGVVQFSVTGRMDMRGVEDIEARFTTAAGTQGVLGPVGPSQLDFPAPAAPRRPFANARTVQRDGSARRHRGAQVIPGHHTLNDVCKGLRNGA